MYVQDRREGRIAVSLTMVSLTVICTACHSLEKWTEGQNYDYITDYSADPRLGQIIRNGQPSPVRQAAVAVTSGPQVKPDYTYSGSYDIKFNNQADLSGIAQQLAKAGLTVNTENVSSIDMKLTKPSAEYAIAFGPLPNCTAYNGQPIVAEVLNTGPFTIVVNSSSSGTVGGTATVTPTPASSVALATTIGWTTKGEESQSTNIGMYTGFKPHIFHCKQEQPRTITISLGQSISTTDSDALHFNAAYISYIPNPTPNATVVMGSNGDLYANHQIRSAFATELSSIGRRSRDLMAYAEQGTTPEVKPANVATVTGTDEKGNSTTVGVVIPTGFDGNIGQINYIPAATLRYPMDPISIAARTGTYSHYVQVETLSAKQITLKVTPFVISIE